MFLIEETVGLTYVLYRVGDEVWAAGNCGDMMRAPLAGPDRLRKVRISLLSNRPHAASIV